MIRERERKREREREREIERENNKSRMGWRRDSSSRVPILQVRSPEFKP
jgi:hypothetical protein